MTNEYVLTISCPDRIGIVHGVAGFLAERGGNILDAQQFSDPETGRFFMRVHFDTTANANTWREDLAELAARTRLEWQLHDLAVKPRVLIMASKQGHCLNDLLYRFRTGALSGELVAVASNHTDWGELTEASRVPFHHMPVSPATRAEQERRLWDLITAERVDVVVLARYMQVLSDDFCAKLTGRVINIHHSFLPSFKGAKPYHQAYRRGVKLIGATAHYVTADLDEGPIIEQETTRVDHAMTPDRLAATGRDLESIVLARALGWHLDHRVLLNGASTIVFR
ncbi:formyltetrahydrofolate deformylase [Stackebrandtia soli]|uniref:formyltetrahydrofolate deformylase n=1 Tax=Stackebrandtia soli TaxID=1892856 RepID=UPI0039E9A4B9